MRAVAPRTGAVEVTIAEDQLEYQPLVVACYHMPEAGGQGMLTRWQPSPEERARIAAGEDIYICQLVFGDNARFTPMAVRCGPGEFQLEGAP